MICYSVRGVCWLTGCSVLSFIRPQNNDPFAAPAINDPSIYMNLTLETVDDKLSSDGCHSLLFTMLFRPCDFPDFVVLKERYDSAVREGWRPMDHCRVRFGEDYYPGKIIKISQGPAGGRAKSPTSFSSPSSASTGRLCWEGITVSWEDKTTSTVNAWELERPESGTRSTVSSSSSSSSKPSSKKRGRDDQGEDAAGQGAGSARLSREETRSLSRLLKQAMEQPHAIPFLVEVTEDIAPGYYNCVPVGMCLERVQERLQNGYYRTVEAMVRDVGLIAENCVIYNGSNCTFSEDAHRLTSELQSKILNVHSSRESSSQYPPEERTSQRLLMGFDF